ncbi:MAG: Arm DNA-binding domain-containing protein [Pirellulales bacterium]
MKAIEFHPGAHADYDESLIGERLIVHDTKAPGLIAELRPGGTLTFYLYRRIEGRPARVRIGPFPAVTVEQARKHAQRLVGDIAKRD